MAYVGADLDQVDLCAFSLILFPAMFCLGMFCWHKYECCLLEMSLFSLMSTVDPTYFFCDYSAAGGKRCLIMVSLLDTSL